MATWLKQLNELIEPMLDRGAWGNIPAFPWEKLASHLKESLELGDISFHLGKSEWKNEEHLLDGLGNYPYLLKIELTPLSGAATLAIAFEDLEKLSRWALSPNTFTDPDMQKSFCKFAALDAASFIDSLGIYQNLRPKVGEAEKALAGYAIDIEVKHESDSIWLRLICDRELQEAIKGHFVNMGPPKELALMLKLPLSIEAGYVSLMADELKSLQVGDALLLDRSSYNPETKKGTFLLSLKGRPLFQMKQKEEGMKVLDFADYQEGSGMNEEINEDEVSAEEKEPLSPPSSIPLTITVEVGKTQMSYDELSSMQPGSVINLNVAPEQGVYLCSGGTRIGRGELVQVGEMVGVKVLELG